MGRLFYDRDVVQIPLSKPRGSLEKIRRIGHAKNFSAKRFLAQLLEIVPFQIKSIQVGSGSGFASEFEQACADPA